MALHAVDSCTYITMHNMTERPDLLRLQRRGGSGLGLGHDAERAAERVRQGVPRRDQQVPLSGARPALRASLVCGLRITDTPGAAGGCCWCVHLPSHDRLLLSVFFGPSRRRAGCISCLQRNAIDVMHMGEASHSIFSGQAAQCH
jgi:hypothetical protein